MSKAPSLTIHLESQGPFDPSAMDVAEARKVLRDYYVVQNGYASAPSLLTPPESQHKLGMSARPAYGLSLAPADMSGWDACIWRTPDCTAACVLVTAGKGTLPSVQQARVLKTRFLAEHPQAFVTLLDAELRAAVAKRGPIDFRPNVASDIRWERVAPALLTIPNVRVYDYTKAPVGQRNATDNYRLVYSVSERPASTANALVAMARGDSAAVVFAVKKGRPLPATWKGFTVIDADTSDGRFDDPRGVVVGLRAKGAARRVAGSEGGFVKVGEAS